MAIFNMVGGGGGSSSNPHIALVNTGKGAATSFAHLNTSTGIFQCDPQYFTLQNEVFTCVKAGTYLCQWFSKAGYNTSGNLINVAFQIRVNGTAVISSTSTSAPGSYGSENITLSVGDTIDLVMKNTTSSSNSYAGAMCLTVV